MTIIIDNGVLYEKVLTNYDEEITNEMSSLLNTVHNIQELKLIKSKSEENKLSK